jgi:two-component system, response regulator PdtaR
MQLSQQSLAFQGPIWASAAHGDDKAGWEIGSGQDKGAEPPALRIVVVEDEPFVRLDIEAVLIAAGHEVVAIADTADGAVAMADRERPDLMIMDVRLLGLRDGVDAAMEIWQRFGIRSLFASANLDAAMRARASRANPLGYVDKPFVASTLLSALPKKP